MRTRPTTRNTPLSYFPTIQPPKEPPLGAWAPANHQSPCPFGIRERVGYLTYLKKRSGLTIHHASTPWTPCLHCLELPPSCLCFKFETTAAGSRDTRSNGFRHAVHRRPHRRSLWSVALGVRRRSNRGRPCAGSLSVTRTWTMRYTRSPARLCPLWCWYVRPTPPHVNATPIHLRYLRQQAAGGAAVQTHRLPERSKPMASGRVPCASPP